MIGAGLAFAAAALSSARDATSKRVAGRLDGATATFASFAFALPWYGLLLAALAPSGREVARLSPALFGLVVVRSASDALGEGLRMRAFAQGDLSLVAGFLSLSPLFALVLSPLVTGDGMSFAGVLGIALVVAGSLSLVLRRPVAGRVQTRAIVLATGASILFAVNACIDRLAVQRATPVFVGFAMAAVPAALLLPLVAHVRHRRQALRRTSAALFARGFLEVAYTAAKLWALRSLPAPYVMAIQRLSMPVSIGAGRVLFKEEDLGRRLLAGGCILCGILVIVLLGRG